MMKSVRAYDATQDRRSFEGDAEKTVVLVGNPNVGKSVIFNFLTKKYVIVSNYPGTTVEVTTGLARLDQWDGKIIDAPGINSFHPASEDERVTRDLILQGRTDGILQVADAKNLRRALLLSLELVEMGLPFTLNLNMMDEARTRGIRIDAERISQILGIDVVPTVAVRKKGLKRLARSLLHQRQSRFNFTYNAEIERAIAETAPRMPEAKISKRALAVMLLSGDDSLWDWLAGNVPEADLEALRLAKRRLEESLKRPVSAVVTERRRKVAERIVTQVAKKSSHGEKEKKKEMGKGEGRMAGLTIHPVWGIPLLVAVLVLMYVLVGWFGAGVLVDVFETRIFAGFVNPWSAALVEKAFGSLLPQGAFVFVRDLLVGQYGLITMALTYSIAIVLPIVGTFFLAFGILEDSGYLPRIAILLNRLFRLMGLNGKAVLPMVLGLGCDTMATITTRILETRKERIITTLLLALGVPCSAQLGVVLGMLGSLSLWAFVVWAGVVTGVIFLVGFLAAKLLGGPGSDFILELPPLRVPQVSNIIVKTLARIEWYLKEAVPLFILGTLLLFFLHASGSLGFLEKAARPVVSGALGLPPEATAAFIVGFLRRDYGAAGLYSLAERGLLDSVGTVVGLVTITLFIPCIANLFVMVKERGALATLYIVLFIFPFSFLVGGILNFTLRSLGASF
jgi:ferrous iron transport protein B